MIKLSSVVVIETLKREIIRELLKKVDFKIGENCSDDYDLKESWEHVRLVLTSFASLFGIKRN